MTSSESDLGRPMPAVLSTEQRPTVKKRRKQTTCWRVRDDIPRRLEVALLISSIAVPLLLWQLLASSGLVSSIALAGPIDTAKAARTMLADGTLLADTWASVQRVYIGFAISL